MAAKSTIGVWVSERTGRAKAALPVLMRSSVFVGEVGTDTISKNLREFIERLEPLAEIENPKSNLAVKEIELSLAVNAKGGHGAAGEASSGSIRGSGSLSFCQNLTASQNLPACQIPGRAGYLRPPLAAGGPW